MADQDPILLEPGSEGNPDPRCSLSEFLRSQHAQSLVEVTFTLPIMLLLVTGMVMAGFTYSNYSTLVEATTAGTHALAVSRGQTTDPCNTVATAVWAAAPGMNASSFTFSFDLNGSQYAGSSCSGNPASTTTGGAASLAANASAQVTVTYPCNYTAYKYKLATTCLLRAHTQEVIQ